MGCRLGARAVKDYHGLTLGDLLVASPAELARYDVGRVNLVCAAGLCGAEGLDVPQYLARLDEWAARVQMRTARAYDIFRRHPERCDHSENVFRMMMLVEVVKLDFKCHYNPERVPNDAAYCPMPFWDSKDLLIHGLLGDDRAGTCNNIPVLVVALGRRLGYPLKLLTTPTHVFARWDDGRERFNVEASNPGGLVIHDDEHYRQRIRETLPKGDPDDCYLRPLTPAEELALFLISRAWVLEAHGRYSEALPYLVRCCELAPTEPEYALSAACMVGYLLDVLHGQRPRMIHVRGQGEVRVHDHRHDPRKAIVDPSEAAMALFLLGHNHDVRGRLPAAVNYYAEARHRQPRNPLYSSRFHHALHKLTRSTEVLKECEEHLATRGPFPRSQPGQRDEARECETLGLKLEREGRLRPAQYAFAGAMLRDSEDEAIRSYLHRVVSKDLLGIQKRTHRFQLSPGRLVASPEMSEEELTWGVVLAQLGRVLEEQGDYENAVIAYCDAFIHNTENSMYWQAAARAARRWIGGSAPAKASTACSPGGGNVLTEYGDLSNMSFIRKEALR